MCVGGGVCTPDPRLVGWVCVATLGGWCVYVEALGGGGGLCARPELGGGGAATLGGWGGHVEA